MIITFFFNFILAFSLFVTAASFTFNFFFFKPVFVALPDFFISQEETILVFFSSIIE